MKCDACHKYDATVAYTQIADDDKKTLYLCSFCAAQTHPKKTDQTPAPQKAETKPKKTMAKGSVLAPAGRSTVTCEGCGMSYSEFKKLGRLGCHQCYVAFEPELTLLLKRLHDAQEHIGKGRIESAPEAPAEPPSEASSQAELEWLRHQLTEAVASEAYEHAAELRDNIARLESNADNRGKTD
jgi:protein arginine kinase activator